MKIFIIGDIVGNTGVNKVKQVIEERKELGYGRWNTRKTI